MSDCDACRTCHECGRTVCFEERPSPGEPDVCDDCVLATALREWGSVA